MKIVQHEWSKPELTIAYYLAKYDYEGLGATQEDIVDSVIPETTVHSLNMQTANFRYLLNIDGYKLSDASKLMKEIVDTYQDTSKNDLRRIVIKTIDKCDLEVGRSSRKNKIIEDRKSELNKLEQKRFEAKLLDYKKGGRRLVPMNKAA